MMGRKTVVLALAASAAALAAWGGSSSAATRADPTFTYVSQNSIVTEFDPASSYSNEVIAMNNIYEQLTRYDSRSKKVTPLLATAWRSTNSGKTWTFTLRAGVKFHTGNPVTAAAAKSAISRTIKLGKGAAYMWAPVKSIDAPTATRLVFHLKEPAPLDLISSSAYAGYIYDTKAAGSADLAKWFNSAKDAGTGPYTVSKWEKGKENELRLEANTSYWGGWSGSHYKHALFKYVPQPTTRAQLFESGEATFTDRLSPALFKQAQGNSKLQTQTNNSFQNLIAFMNTSSGPLENLQLRKAVALAIDYKGIIAALKGSAVPASGFVPEGLLGSTSGLGYRQNIDAAKALVAKSGLKNVTLSMTHANGDADEALVATIVKSNLAQIGVKLDVSAVEWQTQWGRGKSTDPSKRQDIFVMYWYPDYADPFSWFTNLFKSAEPPYFNMSYLKDAKVDATIGKLQALTATNRGAAANAYAGLQRRLHDAAVAVPLFVQNYERVLPKGVKGYVDNPAYANVAFIRTLTPPS